MMKTMHTSADLDAALEASRSEPIVIFKHSATCPFSARAQEQIAEAKHDVPVYALVIQYAGELSEEVATRLGVEHASPQAIVVKDGEAVSHYWRDGIQRDSLVEELRGLAAA